MVRSSAGRALNALHERRHPATGRRRQRSDRPAALCRSRSCTSWSWSACSLAAGSSWPMSRRSPTQTTSSPPTWAKTRCWSPATRPARSAPSSTSAATAAPASAWPTTATRAPSQCNYHAWAYSSDGRLEAVPQLDRWYGRLNLNEWGLYPVAQIDSYQGLIFAHLRPGSAAADRVPGRLHLVPRRLARPARGRLGGRRPRPALGPRHELEGRRGELHRRRLPRLRHPPVGDEVRHHQRRSARRRADRAEQIGTASTATAWAAPRSSTRRSAAIDYARLPGIDPIIDQYTHDTTAETRERLGPEG